MDHAADHRLFEGTSRQAAGDVVLRCALLVLAVVRLALWLVLVPQRFLTGLPRFFQSIRDAWLPFAKSTLAAGSCKGVAHSGADVDGGLNPFKRGTSTIPSAHVCATFPARQQLDWDVSHEFQAPPAHLWHGLVSAITVRAAYQRHSRPHKLRPLSATPSTSPTAPPISHAVDPTRCAPDQPRSQPHALRRLSAPLSTSRSAPPISSTVDLTHCAPYQQHCRPHALRPLSAPLSTSPTAPPISSTVDLTLRPLSATLSTTRTAPPISNAVDLTHCAADQHIVNHN